MKYYGRYSYMDSKDRNLAKELEELEKCFIENGYTKEMIQDIESQEGADTLEEYIDNLEEEQSNWGS